VNVPLEDECEKLKNKKLGTLILKTYVNIIYSVGEFTHSATRELKSKTSEDM